MAWIPLESNPEVMTKYLHKLGVPFEWQMCDIYGLDPDLLATVPRPVLAVLLLFPTSPRYEEEREKQQKECEEKGNEVSENVYYMKQAVSNSCGTIALIHSVANNRDQIQLADGYLKQFLDDAINLDPEERGSLLLAKAEGIITTHKELAQEGQTGAPDAEDTSCCHFVAFVQKDGSLYELDGRKSFPINHGPSTKDTLLEDAAKICEDYIKREPDSLNFTMIALTQAA